MAISTKCGIFCYSFLAFSISLQIVTSQMERSLRVKRSAGTTIDDLTVNLTEVSRQAVSESAVDIGNSFTYELILDLPIIQQTASLDMTAEFFAVNTLTGVGGYCLCHVATTTTGPNVNFTNVDVQFTRNVQAAKTRADLAINGLFATDNADPIVSNMLSIRFQAMLCDLPESTSGSTFYLTAGLQYLDDAYIWVGQIPLKSLRTDQPFDADATIDENAPTIIKKGDGEVIDIIAYITEPSAPISLQVYQPLGFDDLFNIGEITVVTGNAFGCADPELWYNNPQISRTGLSIEKNTIKYDYLVNTDGTRNVTADANKIVFSVPVHVMDLESVPVNVKRDLAFVLTIGKIKMWTGVHTITIDPKGTPSAPVGLTFVQVVETGLKVKVGDSAVFHITVLAQSGWADFNVKTEGAAGIVPILAVFVKTGTVSFVPPWKTVQAAPDKLTLLGKYGILKNAGSNQTYVTLEASFRTLSTLAPGAYTVKCTIGGLAPINLDFTAIVNPIINGTTNIAQIEVEPFDYPVDPFAVPLGGQVCLDLDITVPSGASTDNLVFEVMPDITASSLNTRVCRAQITKVGANLPCVKSSQGYAGGPAIFNVSLASKIQDDYALLTIGPTCPASGAFDTMENVFRVTGCIEIPPYQPFYSPSLTFNVNFGLRQDGSVIWLASNQYITYPANSLYSGDIAVAGTCYDDSIHFQITSTLASYTLTSAYLCQYQCQIVAKCVRFTYSKVSSTCWLTTSYTGNLYTDATIISGPKYCTEECMNNGYNYVSNSQVNLGAGSAATEYECQAKCAASSTCVRFNFYVPTKVCYLCKTLAGSKITDPNYINGPPICTGPVRPAIFALDQQTSVNYPNQLSFKIDQGFHINYLIKLQAQTFGTYDFRIPDQANFKICRITLTHIGKNFPCTQSPGSTTQLTDNVLLTWSSIVSAYQCGTGAGLSFKSLTNWGRQPMFPDFYPDENSIMVTVWYQVCATGFEGVVNLNYNLEYGTASITGSSPINVQNSNMEPSINAITNATYESLIGPLNLIYKKIPKILRFNLTIPEGFQNDIVVKAINNDYLLDKHVDFCNIQVVGSGNNVPCFNPDFSVVTITPSTRTFKDEIVFQEMSMSATKICSVYYSSVANDSVVSVEVAFRVKDSVAIGQTINIGFSVISGTTAGYLKNFTFTVAEPDLSKIKLSLIEPEDVKVLTSSNFTSSIQVGVGQKIWVPFFVRLPPQTITPVQISFMAPPVGNRPSMHLIDVQFDTCAGNNVLCVKPPLDLQRTYPTVFNRSDYITAFMSKDSLTVDLGYVVNAGFSEKWGSNVDEDNQFSVKVLIQMGDVNNNMNGNPIYFSIKLGDVIVVGSQLVLSTRNSTDNKTRQCCERGNIIVDLIQSLPQNTSYARGDSVAFQTTIYHHDNQVPGLKGSQSLAEGWQHARIRILAPKHMQFDNTSLVSNYTFSSTLPNRNVSALSSSTNVIDLLFPMGILFPDIISLNFSMIIDPNGIRPIGKGNELSTVVMFPLCQQSSFNNYPSNTSSLVTCGGVSTNTLIANVPDCFDALNITNECQVIASSMMNSNHKPFNSISVDQVWAPALRDGSLWREFLKFNLGGTARITGIMIKSPALLNGINYRVVSKVLIEASSNCDNFVPVYDSGIPVDGVVRFSKTVVASNIKITITGLDSSENADSSPMALNNVTFFGCMPYKGNFTCCPDTTIDATSAVDYRHLAVDTNRNIIYFCDRKFYLEGMYCYYNDRKLGINLWTELPRYITSIEGYSKTTGRMYFRGRGGKALFSTFNGILIELTPEVELAGDVLPATPVPGFSSTELGDIAISGTNFTTNFQSIKEGNFVLAQWSPCCDGKNEKSKA